jgi:hypothetical protein
VGRVTVLGEVGVELHGVLRDHVQFSGEDVEVPNHTLKFEGEVAVLFLQSTVVRFAMGVSGADGFDLYGLGKFWMHAERSSGV